MVTYRSSSFETSAAFDQSVSLPHIYDFRNLTKFNDETEAAKKTIYQLQKALDLICPPAKEFVTQLESTVIQPQKKTIPRSKSVEPPSRASNLFKKTQVTVAAGTSKGCLRNVVKYDESIMPSDRSQQQNFSLPLEPFLSKHKDSSPDWQKKLIIDSRYGPARNRNALAFRNGLESAKDLWKPGEKLNKQKLQSLVNAKNNVFPWDGKKDEILYQARDINEDEETENTKRLIKMIDGPSVSKPLSRSSSMPTVSKRLQTPSKTDAISTFTEFFVDPETDKKPEITASTFNGSNFSMEMFGRTQRRFKKLGVEHRIPRMPKKERTHLTDFVESEYINKLINDDVHLANEIDLLMRRSFMRKLYKQNEVQRNWFSARVLEADIDHLSYRIKEEAVRFKLLRNQKHGPKKPEKVLDAWDSKRDAKSWLRPSRQAKLRHMGELNPEDVPKLDKFSLASPKDAYLELIDKPIMDPGQRYMIGERKVHGKDSPPQTKLKLREQSRGALKSERSGNREQQSRSVPSRSESRRQTSRGKENMQPYKLAQEEVNDQGHEEIGQERKKRIVVRLLELLRKLQRLGISPRELSKLDQILNKKPFEKPEMKDLLKAVKQNDLFEVEFLVDKNCYVVYDFDQMHQTALHWAVKRNFVKIAQHLINKRSDVDAEDITGNTPLYYALKANNLELIQALLVARASPWRTRRVRYKDLAQDWVTEYYLYQARRISIGLRYVPANLRELRWKKEVKVFSEKPTRLRETSTNYQMAQQVI